MIESTAKKISREYQENENFAPKQNERDCPMTCVTGQSHISCYGAKAVSSATPIQLR